MKFITYNKAHHVRLWRFAVMLLAAIAIMLVATLWRGGDAPAANFFSPSVVLAAPSSQLPASFPSSSFNMSAYLDTGQPIDLDKITAVYPTVRLVGAGSVVVNAGSAILYVSDDGWLVAGFESNTWLASLGEWPVPAAGTPQIYAHVTSFDALSSVIGAAVTASGNGSNASGISYYHWGYPSATKIIVFSRSTYGLPTTMSFTIPDSVTLLQASYSNAGGDLWCRWVEYYGDGRGQFLYDGEDLVCGSDGLVYSSGWTNNPANSVEHTIKLTPRSTTQKLAIAMYLLIE